MLQGLSGRNLHYIRVFWSGSFVFPWDDEFIEVLPAVFFLELLFILHDDA